MVHSPIKSQWGLNQVATRYDQSPTKSQWDASITLKAIQSESLPIRGTSPNGKYSIPHSLPSPTSTSSFQQHLNQPILQRQPQPQLSSSTPGSSDTGKTNSSYSTLHSKHTAMSSLHSSSSNLSTMYAEPISPRTTLPPKVFMDRTTSKQKEDGNLNKYSMSIDTVKAQQLLSLSSPSNALGVYRNVQELSPTSKTASNNNDHYWQGGESPYLLRGSEPPLMYVGSTTSSGQKGTIETPRATTTTNNPSSSSNQNKFDPIEIIEQEARALLLARYQGFSNNSKPTTNMKQQLEKKEAKATINPPNTFVLSNDLPKKVRINPDGPSEIRSSGKVKSSHSSSSSSSSSFFKKAFRNNSPYKQQQIPKQQQQHVEERKKSLGSIKDMENTASLNIATKRSIMRHTQSANSIHLQYHHQTHHQSNQSSSRNNLPRMISAPILMKTSSPASPALNSSFSRRKLSTTNSSTRETIEAFEQVRNEIREENVDDERQNFEKQKRYQKRPAPPPPPRRRQRSSTATNSPIVSPLSISTTTSSISNRSPFTPPDLAIPIDDQKMIHRKNSNDEYFSNPSKEISPLLYVKEVGKERKNSNAASIQSSYDQDSWSGHSPQSQSKRFLPLKEEEKKEEGVKILETDCESESSLYEEPIPFIFTDPKDNKKIQKISSSPKNITHSPPFESTRRPSIPTHYKIVRTSEDDSKEFEKIDSILLYEDEGEEEHVLDLSDSLSIEFASSTLTSTTTKENEKEQNGKEEKILKRKPSTIRESGYFDLDAMAQHTQPIRNKWSNKETGKLNTLGMIVITASSTIAYISPVQFKEIHGGISTNEMINSPPLKSYDKLDDNERFLLSVVPIYERIFTRLWQISHWNNRKESFLWCLCYFTLWYFNSLIPGLLTILIVKIINGKKHRTVSQQGNSTKFNHFFSNLSNSNSNSANSSPTLNGEEVQPIKLNEIQQEEAIEALRRYEQIMIKFTANTADIHERVQNMSKWARKPATMRSLIIISIMVLSSFFLNANDFIRLIGLFFGFFFFLFSPIFSILKKLQKFKKSSSHSSSTSTNSTFNPIDFFLAGVPNDAENEILINNRKRLAQEKEEQEKEKERQKLQKSQIKNKIIVQPDHARSIIKEESKIIPLTRQNKDRTFKATYGEEEIDDNRFGLLTISTERLLFTNQAPSFEVLVNVSLDQIVQIDQIDKVRRGVTMSDNESQKSTFNSSSQNEGLRILVKDKNTKKIDFHTFLNMNSRDEAFDRILTSVPN